MNSLYAISAQAFADETHVVRTLLDRTASLATHDARITERATAWAEHIRTHGAGAGVEAFLGTYGLNTTEGVALMCLAEALLRIPDATTADALIQATFEGREWGRYTDAAHAPGAWMVQLSSWGLLLTGKVVDFGQDAHAGMLRTFKQLVHRMGEPIIREALKKAMGFIGAQFVLGETMEEALQHAQRFMKHGYRFSFDILGEGARSDAQAAAYVESYQQGIAQIARTVPEGTPLWQAPSISVKLSALHARYQFTQRHRVMAELLPRLKDILVRARDAGIAVSIDAEEATRLDVELELFENLLSNTEFAGWHGIGFVVQAYQKRALPVIGWLAERARIHKRVLPVRLVKGAYWDAEIKWAQVMGLPGYPVFTRKTHTDVSYLACAHALLQERDVFFPQFATHNARTAASVITLAEAQGWAREEYEMQRLHGMGEALHDQLLAHSNARIYAPVGAHKALLAYLIRRLLENGANSSFVHLLTDPNHDIADVVADPVHKTRTQLEEASPLPLPHALYGSARRNSAGIDMGNAAMVEALESAVQMHAKAALPSAAKIAPEDVASIVARAQDAFTSWATEPVEVRASVLERAADALEAERDTWLALLAQEGGKTLPDGIAEVREAADFCRYYAAQARALFAPNVLAGPTGEHNVLHMHSRGVFACISPWNFPLAIFMGQVAAALVCGNSVVAKPAEQTPLIAMRAVATLHAAGVPKDALQLTIGSGSTVGNALISDARVGGVVFTGGTDTAQRIAKTLAARGGPLVPFIAETGGQNCMVVDSSALLEQTVDDVMLSAFGSAGQRCSALRVLFIQEEVAEEFLPLLAGAMQELRLGDPLNAATDIGPVIDARAAAALHAHIEHLHRTARFVAAAPLPENTEGRAFVAPHAFEIGAIEDLTQEHFGPVLHVIRFAAGTLAEVADAINRTGYGLTFGIQSRIEPHIHLLATRVRAGNIYVNRSMIGATVGVQPFGGEALSGTGPKAGGPHYLYRFVTERTITTNTAAVGGNVSLLASNL